MGGPIKGSYAIKYIPYLEDLYQDYISDFGVYVEDPCQAIDNKRKITLTPGYTTSRDLKYHEGTNSTFWLRKVCQNSKALHLVDVSAFPFLQLRHGNLAILSTPTDQCTRLEVQHDAPDSFPITNVFYLHILSSHEAKLETCSPHHGNCQPNIKNLALTGTAGLRKTVTLFQ
jgi:hypothetical protein